MPQPPSDEGRDFYLVQARLRALTEKSPDTALEWFDHRIDRADVSQAESDAIFYGRAIALQRSGEYAEARKLLQNLMDRGRHAAYELQLADLDLEYSKLVGAHSPRVAGPADVEAALQTRPASAAGGN